eukprot:2623218-Prorocentrum_lima.AAC.1
MTSSLVGSEMCIRDRYFFCRCPCRPVLTRRRYITPALASPLCVSFCPVSYTHLTLPTICSV